MLPLLSLPFLVLAFWALGGGKGQAKQAEPQGLNTELPAAHIKEEKELDKLAFYDRAEKDSQKMSEWMRTDPFFSRDSFPGELEAINENTASKYSQRLNTSLYGGAGHSAEDQLLEKLASLQNELNKPARRMTVQEDAGYEYTTPLQQRVTPVYEREEDPELKQLEGTLDRILDIQHPERVKERMLLHKKAVYAVRKDPGDDTLVSGFFSYSSEEELSKETGAIEAAVISDQVIVNGAVLKLRLLDDVYIKGARIPKDNLISGTASLEGERLHITIASIRCGKNLYEVELEVYDMDGLPGIYIPGAITRDVAKESANNSLALLEIGASTSSLKTQAAGTGINAIKNLLSKKVKLVRVLVKAGYKVLLKNKNQ